MIKIALFDLDGVVIKDPIFSTVYAAEFGIKPEDMLPFFSNEFEQCMLGAADLREVIAPYLREWKWGGTVDELLQYWMTRHANVDTQLLTLVSKLREKGIKTGIQTNQEKYRTDYIWNKLGFNKLFDHLFVSCELQARKPQSTFFTKILQTLSPVEADEILFIDDSMNNIATAKDFGFKTHYYTNYKDLEQVITSL